MAGTYDEAMKRTHTCGQLRAADVGQHVRLCGWVRSYRDHGGVVFVDLRDREGITQLVFDPSDDPGRHALARQLRGEWVISVAGKVRPRGSGRVNPKLPTGEIEVLADDLVVLNKADTPPFDPENAEGVAEETRLRYRYIDLRRPEMARNLLLRARICQAMRRTLDERGFIEIETPFMTKSTPGGARNFLVASRLHPGHFYALSESPQLFKQILMIAGMDKYYQIARCFRDEDLRADRQMDFTQLDLEMAFPTEETIMDATNAVLRQVCQVCGKSFPEQPRRISYREAMDDYGIDRPDLRFEMRLRNVTDIAAASSFKVFTDTVAGGGIVKGVCAPGGGKFTRKEIDGYTTYAADFGAKGLAWCKIEKGALAGGSAKFFDAAQQAELLKAFGAKDGDILFFVADKEEGVNKALAALRCKLGEELKLYDAGAFCWCWVTDFPLLEYSQQEQAWVSKHHPFTSPRPEDLDKLESDPGAVMARAYDIVLNGVELGGGSIRIHSPEVQARIFRRLGISDEEAREKFSFLLDALRFGAPPHGGVALGLDRIVMMMVGAESLRDVIAFPKTQRGICPLTDAPSPVTDKQLAELHLKVSLPEAKKPPPSA